MLHGLMVVNAFLRTTKFDDIYHTLLSAAHGEGMELDVRTNAELCCETATGAFAAGAAGLAAGTAGHARIQRCQRHPCLR